MTTVLDDIAADDAVSPEPAPVDADVAAQSAMVEQVAAAVVETVIAATIAPVLPSSRRAARPVDAAEADPASGETGSAAQIVEEPAGVEVLASDAPVVAADDDALSVTVVDERSSEQGDVAVILQSTDGPVETTPVALPTSPITLPASRRSRRRPVAIEQAAADEPLVEPEVTLQAAPPVVTAEATADGIADEFEAASRLFCFTGETPVQAAKPVPVSAEPVTQGLPTDAAPRTRRNGRRIAAASFSVGVMGLVGLMTVGMTMPVSALASASGTANVVTADAPTTNLVAGGDVSDGAIQAYVAPAAAQAAVVDRADGYSAATYAQVAVDSGIRYPSNFYVNDPTAAIQWPFAVGVSITYGFGMRDGVMHEGADFVPGEGAPVQAIADGTVRVATEQGGGYGVMVIIDHKIDGQLVSSRYGHMLYGSLQVTQGQQVHVGQVIGHTGDTGRSFGAHTHFEILQGGATAIDPIVWLRANAGRHSLD